MTGRPAKSLSADLEVQEARPWPMMTTAEIGPVRRSGLRCPRHTLRLAAARMTLGQNSRTAGSRAWHHQVVTLTRNAPLRYYVYISDYKLDMLYEQISPALRRRISGELKIDLKLAGLTVRGSEEPEATRMAKLRAVEHYIDKHHQVGDISEPGREFFRGSMDMQWGWLTPREGTRDCICGKRHSSEESGWAALCGYDERISPVVIFRGRQRHAQGVDFVLLGGSRKHVLGSGAESEPAALLVGGGSPMPNLVIALERCVSQLQYFDPREGYLPDLIARWNIESGLSMTMKGPCQRLDFLAVPYGRTEIKFKDGTLYGVIGSPIYVAHG